MGRKSRDDTGDKEWARKYILDPLTAPEPSEETGLGTSHFHQLRQQSPPGSSSNNRQSRSGAKTSAAAVASGGDLIDVIPADNTKPKHHRHPHPHHHRHNSNSYPTPPTSASPTRSIFHPSNPYSLLDTHLEEGQQQPPQLPSPPNSPRQYPPVSRSSSARVPPQPRPRPDPRHHRSISADHFNLRAANGNSNNPALLRRYPGDMSHRPLDMLKKEARAADRAPHLRRKHLPGTDIIDSLDTIGGTYHHGGPYDATLASRNAGVRYPPVDAVHNSNMEAIRATPREYLQDSLERHMPLQGTAVIPSGGEDMGGNVMSYEEGADLMREPDAAGGAYKRWEGMRYHPDDLKGKGEPSYTYERDLKERKAHRSGEFEMRPGVNGSHRRRDAAAAVRQRSLSNEAGPSTEGQSNSADLQRSNTTGKRLSDGIKRRFGSIRPKKGAAEEVHTE